MKLAIAGMIAFCVLLIGGAVFFATRPSAPKARILPLNEQYVQRQEKGAWTKGSTNPTVTLTEYADFQCPGCAGMSSVIREAMAQVDFVKFEYKHYPLTQHNKARIAARAAESAGRQGKFWEMHDIIFANQQNWDNQSIATFRETLESYASSLALNMDQFKSDLNDDSLDKNVNQDITDGNKLPVTGTPTLVVNGTRLQSNPRTAEELVSLLQASQPQQ